MAYEIIIKKRFTNKLLHVVDYPEREWGKNVANAFLDKVRIRINSLPSHPHIDALTSIKNIKRVHNLPATPDLHKNVLTALFCMTVECLRKVITATA